MECPKCKAQLIVSGQARLETLLEHVSDPNGTPSLKDKYVCSNADCVCNKHNVCWNSDGETYGGYKLFGSDELTSPYGTLERRLEIEIYKKGLKKRTLLPAWLLLWFLKPVIEHEYKADEDGNVLKKYYKLSIWKSGTKWKPFKKNSEFCIGATWWVRTWRCLWKRYRKKGFDKSHNRDFPYRAFEWFILNVVELNKNSSVR